MMNQTRVLVVDDEPTTLKLMEGLLEQLNCRVAVAKNGKKAIEQIKKFNFDICFMDIMMPEMGGVEAASIIREDYTKILPIVAITSYNMKATKEKCYDVGMVDFIVKPVDLPVIRKAIERYALSSP